MDARLTNVLTISAAALSWTFGAKLAAAQVTQKIVKASHGNETSEWAWLIVMIGGVSALLWKFIERAVQREVGRILKAADSLPEIMADIRELKEWKRGADDSLTGLSDGLHSLAEEQRIKAEVERRLAEELRKHARASEAGSRRGSKPMPGPSESTSG